MNLYDVIFAESISSEGGVQPTGEIEINENGEYDVTDYAVASVYISKVANFGSITINTTNSTQSAVGEYIKVGYLQSDLRGGVSLSNRDVSIPSTYNLPVPETAPSELSRIPYFIALLPKNNSVTIQSVSGQSGGDGVAYDKGYIVPVYDGDTITVTAG